MQEFEHIQSLWQSHSVEVKISSAEMLAQAKKEVKSIRTKSLLNIAGMVISFLAIGSILVLFDFNSWTTPLGIGIIISTVGIYTLILYKEYLLISKNDFTAHPAEYLAKLKTYQLSRANLHNKLYWFYTFAISVGVVLYFYETLNNMDLWVQVSFVLFTLIWIIFCATILRKGYMQREKERIDLLIEKFKRISSQIGEK